MKILITSGSTSEPIDRIRNITNFSTGKTGMIIANLFSSFCDVEEIFYICGKFSSLPTSEKIKVIFITDVFSLEQAINNVLKENLIDIIIHSMAVSDYRVKSVNLSDGQAINNANKIDSGEKNITLVLEPTPKIISMFKYLSPNSILVGFKLLDNVSHNVLINTAFELLKKNGCDFVLANDFSEISSNKHIGYLIDEKKNYIKYENKTTIANAIVDVTRRKLL